MFFPYEETLKLFFSCVGWEQLNFFTHGFFNQTSKDDFQNRIFFLIVGKSFQIKETFHSLLPE